MDSPHFSKRFREAGETLLEGVSSQIIDYSDRFQSLDKLYSGILEDIIKTDFQPKKASDTARRFFGKDRISFAAIDGTEYIQQMFDLVVFYGGSYMVKGIIDYSSKFPKVKYSKNIMKSGIGVSSCVPLYINQIIEVEHATEEVGEEEGAIERPLTDEAVVNNSRIADWIMTFSEFYLAYKLAASEDRPNIIIMDRSLLTMVSSLIYDTRRSKSWDNSVLLGYKCDGNIKLDKNDIMYNRYRIENRSLNLPAPRGDYLRYALAYLIQEEGSISFDDVCERLEIQADDRRQRSRELLKRGVEEGYLKVEDNIYHVQNRYYDSWSRVKSAVLRLSRQIFEDKDESNPMKVKIDGDEKWLTTLDLAFLTLFTINMLVEECWMKNILLIGITKDTTARDFKTHLLPVMVNEGVWELAVPWMLLDKAPNTDRMLLQYLSAINYSKLKVPWALVEYDSAFRMIIPELKSGREGFVSGAIRNRIMYERLFLKSYIQLSQASTNPQLRSNVLLIDRLVYPEFDLRPETTAKFKHNYGGALEPVDVIFYGDNSIENPIQNMIMVTLKAMEKSSIPEVFGHNLPLFMADKVAKWHCNEMRRIIDSTKVWVVNNPKIRRHLFYMSTFRERRSEVEQDRRTG